MSARTKTRNESIASAYERGALVKELSTEFGLTEGTIKNIVLNQGASRQTLVQAKQNLIREFVEMGGTIGMASEVFGVSESWAKRIVDGTTKRGSRKA